jgi:hypothetical protein
MSDPRTPPRLDPRLILLLALTALAAGAGAVVIVALLASSVLH